MKAAEERQYVYSLICQIYYIVWCICKLYLLNLPQNGFNQLTQSISIHGLNQMAGVSPSVKLERIVDTEDWLRS